MKKFHYIFHVVISDYLQIAIYFTTQFLFILRKKVFLIRIQISFSLLELNIYLITLYIQSSNIHLIFQNFVQFLCLELVIFRNIL